MKRTLIALSIVVVITAIIFAVSKSKNIPDTVLDTKTPEVTAANVSQNKDSDSDSLKDWEETLWGTNPEVKDTDGDGTNDGEEVKVGRDPRVKGPGDAIKDTSITSIADDSIGDLAELNATQRLGRSIFLRYMNAKKDGGEVNPEQEKKILEASIAELSLKIAYKTYATSSLKTITQDTPEKIKAYGDSLATIAKKNSPKNNENELEILQRILENGENEEDAKKLLDISEGYQSIINAYLVMPVPKSAISAHLSFINSLSKVRTNIEGFSKINTDSVLVLANFLPYLKNIEEMKKSFNILVLFFIDSNVKFETTSPGYTFTQPATQ